MKLYFRNSYGALRELGEYRNTTEVNKEINKFLNEHNFKSYYTRIWYEPAGTVTPYEEVSEGRFVYDVGSHSEFFELYVNEDEIEMISKGMQNMIKEK